MIDPNGQALNPPPPPPPPWLGWKGRSHSIVMDSTVTDERTVGDCGMDMKEADRQTDRQRAGDPSGGCHINR